MKLRPADQKVVRASRVLSWGQKGIVLDTAALDGPDHAFITAERQALRLGVRQDYVKKTRVYLEAAGVVKKHAVKYRPGSLEVIWLPAWRPQGERPSDEEAVMLAAVYDAYILQHLKGARIAPSSAELEGVQIAPSSIPAKRARIAPSAAVAEGAQIAPSPAHLSSDLPSPAVESETPPFSPPPSEKGVFAHEQDEKRGLTNPDWEAVRESLAPWSQRKRIQPVQPTPVAAVLSGVTPAATSGVPLPDNSAALRCFFHGTELDQRPDGTAACDLCEAAGSP